MHTHLFPPSFGPLLLWGIDELLTLSLLGGGSDARRSHAVRKILGSIQVRNKPIASGKNYLSSAPPYRKPAGAS